MKIIVDDEEIVEVPLLKRPSLLPSAKIISPESKGRKEGGTNKTQIEKELIALDGALSIDMSQKEIAKIHNVTTTEVSNHSRGFDRSNIDTRKNDIELKAVINQAKYQIADVATAKLMESLNLFQPRYLEQKELPIAAKNMAIIMEKVSQNFEGEKNNVNFIVYAPRMRSEDSYDIIEVTE
jgi:hypothetical protein